MAEYASKGVGAGALTTGIIGTSLAGLMALNGNDGLLGGLFGNSRTNERIAALMAENTELKSKSYTDAQIKDTAAEICELRGQQIRQGEQIAAMQREAELREQITDGKIARVADAATCGIQNLQCALNCLQQTVNGITRTFVPAGAVTPLPTPYPYPPTPPYPVVQKEESTASTAGA